MAAEACRAGSLQALEDVVIETLAEQKIQITNRTALRTELARIMDSYPADRWLDKSIEWIRTSHIWKK